MIGIGEVMEQNEISEHQARIFRFLQQHTQWQTSQQVAIGAQVAMRTARHHLLQLTQLGLLDQAEVFPGHRYRLSSKADKRNGAYMRRLETACEIFGM
jgi:DNA-binding transcriptional ArsR family regulator